MIRIIRVVTQISKRPLKKDVEIRLHSIFQIVIKSLKSDEEISDFLMEFLSPVERIMLAKRLAIAVLLAKGYTYPSIATILHVTPSTISHVSLQLKYSGKGYKKVTKRLIENEKVKDFFGKLEDLISSTPPPKYFDPEYISTRYEKKQNQRKKPF